MDEQNNIPVDENEAVEAEQPEAAAPPPPPEATNGGQRSDEQMAENIQPGYDSMGERLERLGGEPAPVITPEEFARLQKAGQVHIDSRGRVRTTRRSDAEAGVSLRKRRAWYSE